MTRLFLVIALFILPANSFSFTFSEDFSTLTKIDTSNTNLTVITAALGRGVRLPLVSSFEDLARTGTSQLTSVYTSSENVTCIAYGDSIFLIGGSGPKIVSYDGSTFTDRAADFYSITTGSYTRAIFANGSFYVSGNVSGGNFSKFDTTPSDYLICSAFLNSFDTSVINSLDYNGTYWMIGGNNGRLNSWNACTTVTCATSLSNALQGTGGFAATDTVSAIANNTSYWLLGGTNGNIAKYDGTNLTSLTADSNASLSTNNIKAITWNGTEFLIGTAGGKLARYNGTSFTSCTASVSSTNGGCFGTSDINAIVWNGLDWIIGGASGRLCVYDSTDTTPISTNFTALGTNTAGTTKMTLLSSGWGTNAINAMCWSGTNLLVGGSTAHLDKVSGFYDGSAAKSLVSNKVNTTTDRIYSVALNATAVTNGQTIVYYVSCDGGTNWQSIQNNNSATVISNTGFDLRWKMDMTGIWRTPKITAVELNYLAMDQTILPRNFGGDIVYSGDILTKLYIPVNTLTSDVKFAFTSVASPPVSTQAPATAVAAFDLTAKNNVTGADITEFSKALDLTLHTTSSGGTVTGTTVLTADAATSLAIAYWNGLHWIPVSTKVTVSGTDVFLKVKISHLSRYAIVVASPLNIIATAEPNPFTPSSASTVFNRTKITFPNPDQVTAGLKIWDRNGSLMREYSVDGVSQVEWDGKDTQGSIVESGVYFYEAVVGGASKAKGTVVVGR
ncbi:MAG: hypothetical protein V1752_06300 [Candidatus Firestonebacteria bacterium]